MTEGTAAGRTERFLLKRLLGTGGFGTVYEAVDRKRNAVVALKILRDATASDLYRFKQEFRAISGITHPNLVTLYELISEGEQWCFSMELVEGTDFLSYVRRPDRTEAEGDRATKPARPGERGTSDDDLESPDSKPPDALPRRTWDATPASVVRLLASLRQLADGLATLHAAGIVHRDVKPANVLCTPEGRVVLLDFGISHQTWSEREASTASVIGTPDYMSPEQASEQRITTASDWYSVGVLLYEVLTGGLPFAGTSLQVIRQKVGQDPAAPSEIWPGVPPGLDALCRQLLQRDPSARPSDDDVMACLRGLEADIGGDARSGDRPDAPASARPFVGRERELLGLAAAYEEARSGKTIAALVYGGSGAGKSALCRRFLRDLNDRDEHVVILTGRCFEHEDVPFKALDGVIDSLSRYLQRRPAGEAESLLPRDVHALARLFPSLLQAKAVKSAPERRILDALQVRQAAFGALRELLLRLSDRRPIVLYIDDLQWGDPDGIALLVDVLRPPDPPPLLLLLTYRSGEDDSSPALQALHKGLRGELSRSVAVREVPVGELSAADSAALASALLPEGEKGHAAEIAAEAAGNAFFLTELTRSLLAGLMSREPGSAPTSGFTLDAVVRARVQRLPEDARQLLAMVAVGGQPVPREAATLAAYGEPGDSRELQALALLRAERLVRVRHARSQRSGSATAEELLPYHDRVRETVIASLDRSVLAAHHLALGRALAQTGAAEPERLVFHFQSGGDVASAGRFALEASAVAHNALAYHQSARLCRVALSTGTLSPEDVSVVEARLADALAGAGRPKEAAERYLALAERSGPQLAFERRRLAATQLFGAGYVDEGRAVLRAIIGAARLRMPKTRLGLSVSGLWYQLLITLRGYRFLERTESQVPPDDLLRIDTCNAVGFSAPSDPLLAASFLSRSLWYALRAGEPRRVSVALGFQGIIAAALVPALGTARRAVARATELAERVGDPMSVGNALRISGHLDHFDGSWAASSALFLRAAEVLQSNCIEATPHIDFIKQLHAYNLRWMGSFTRLAAEVPPMLGDAAENGKEVSELVLRCTSDFLLLLRDDAVDLADESVRGAEQRLASQAFNVVHLHATDARVMILLYQGRGREAKAVIDGSTGRMRRARLLRIDFFGLMWRNISALTCVAANGDLRVAEREARHLARARQRFAAPMAALIRALVARRRGRSANAVSEMETAERQFAACDMRLHANVARLRRGEWVGGEEGQAISASAREWMAAEGVRRPDRMAAMIAPD